MNHKIDRIGRTAAVISSLILCALLLNIWVLNAGAEERHETILKTHYYSGPVEPVEQKWIEKVYDFTLSFRTSADLIAGENTEKLHKINRRGNPFAYVLLDKMYIVDRHGRIIASADSCAHYDLPIISGENLSIDENQYVLDDAGSKAAIELLHEIQKHSEIEPLVSELKVSNSGIIAYFNMGRVIPVIFGQGGWTQKLENLIAYEKQLGSSELATQALWLDLRIKDRIILKKNV